ncbi:PAAR domain-containing protein [Aquimarina sp. I32.4]|uniref:PAAR domain-containing protein n=1 Tax=Aquimarina sp. I32.4 TaxID=2053903 RepID=UPI000CDED60F|nr:PAAR domain-containing protein [Aquimarina sp. I32.4]
MAKKPIAVVGSMHTCPMYNGSTPHVGGPITTSGAPGVTINGQAIALQGDKCACTGAIDTIVQGSSGVFVNGIPIATVGCKTAHGGEITTGIAGVTISKITPDIPTNVTLPPSQIPTSQIPTSQITLTNRLLGNTTEAQANQEALREPEEGEPRVYNPRWINDQVIRRNSRQIRQITLVADVYNIPDGQTATFSFDIPEVFDRPEESVTLSGEVQNKQVEIIWEIEDLEDSNTL